MRTLTMAILTAAAVAVTVPAQAQTYDPDYPVCMQVYGRVGYIDCRYTSLPQCNATASGRSAECLINPYYANPRAKPPVHAVAATIRANHGVETIRVRRSGRHPATPAGPFAPPDPCCGSRSASPPASP